MHRRPGCVLLAACLTTFAACATPPGVVSTEARSTPSTEPSPQLSTTSNPSTDSTQPTPSTTPTDDNGIGDSLFPSLGNPGIDVQHYTLALQYDALRNDLSGTVHLDVAMTDDRDEFSLDSDGPIVSKVLIDGQPAKFEAADPELLITPNARLSRGQHIAVDITYRVSPRPVKSQAGEEVGWFPTTAGAYVLDEPEGAHTWVPCDDHPSDKATFRFDLHVDAGKTGVANGALIDHTSSPGGDTWIWQEDQPTATYLVQLLIGDYTLVDGVGPDNLPLLSVVLQKDRTTMQPYLDTISDQIDFFDDYFGPYPFDRYGIAITDSFEGLAMETTERPTFSRADFASGRLDSPQQLFLSHELAHQWFGDAVSPARWKDIWLNESFATYAEWMWLEHIGMGTVDSLANAGLLGRIPGSTADPTVPEMFGYDSYEGGAVVLHALRKTIGDDLFFTLLRRWVADNKGSSRTTEDFVALANRVSGMDLTKFFATWLYADTLPAAFPG
ncbi:MAG TPA: M1 family metallopeptidase [Ilumatobacteraceae bacterium]